MANWYGTFKLFKNHILTILQICLIVDAFQDNRCYLENGASSETFFVAEDLPIGSIIGRVRVVGDPHPHLGSIVLRLKERDSPVAIPIGSKNLTLTRQLDKEGLDGPPSVFVNLICERLGTLDPGFVIPINIRVTDANDNAPVFVNAPYVLNIPEVTVVGTRVLQGVHAIDNDQQGPYSSVKYSLTPGPYSNYFEFENELEGTLVLRKALDYETLKGFDVKIRAQDHGDPPKSTETTLTVHVMDADDQNPRFLDDKYTSIVSDSMQQTAQLQIQPRDIHAFDQDEGINASIYYTWNNIGNEYTLFQLDKKTGAVFLGKTLQSTDLQNPAILVIRATQEDNPDRYALTTLTITRHAFKGIKFLHSIFNFKVSEALPPKTTIGSFVNNRPGEHLKYFVSDQNILNTFAINTLGEIILKEKLDYEAKQEYVFKIFATDGKTNDSSVVHINVENFNEWEPRFRYSHYEFFVDNRDIELHHLIGKVEAADGDRDDQLTLTLNGPDAHMFFVTPNGEIRLKNIKGFAGTTATFTVTASDNGNPPKNHTVPVTIHFSSNIKEQLSIIPKNRSSTNVELSTSSPMLLGSLGGILMLLSLIVAFLVTYICKVRRSPVSDTLPRPPTDNLFQKRSVTNPFFGGSGSKTAGAVAIGGIPRNEMKSKLPSMKVHPAPQPPAANVSSSTLWSSAASRVKKLSWGDDKAESGSTETLNNLDTIPKVLENSNLTVYF